MESLPDTIGFECQRCSKCCEWGSRSLSATKDDIKRWQEEGREDILQYVDFMYVKVCPDCDRFFVELDKKTCTCGANLKLDSALRDLWFNPVTGEELERCPFLRKVRNKKEYRCQIHDTKPSVCRDFPVAISFKCGKCNLNFVKHFKDTKLKHVSLNEFFSWTLNDFFIKVLNNIEKCPECGEPISMFDEWAIENCPGVVLYLESLPYLMKN